MSRPPGQGRSLLGGQPPSKGAGLPGQAPRWLSLLQLRPPPPAQGSQHIAMQPRGPTPSAPQRELEEGPLSPPSSPCRVPTGAQPVQGPRGQIGRGSPRSKAGGQSGEKRRRCIREASWKKHPAAEYAQAQRPQDLGAEGSPGGHVDCRLRSPPL